MGSTGSKDMAATVWAILGATVGTPSIRTPFPDFFGISTALTGEESTSPSSSCSRACTGCSSTPARTPGGTARRRPRLRKNRRVGPQRRQAAVAQRKRIPDGEHPLPAVELNRPPLITKHLLADA